MHNIPSSIVILPARPMPAWMMFSQSAKALYPQRHVQFVFRDPDETNLSARYRF